MSNKLFRQRTYEPADIDGLFTDDNFRSKGDLTIRNLPYLVRPIIESMHQIKPDIVIAGDRGARLFAYTALQSWRWRFPDEPFPTRSGGIQFARVTSRSADYDEVYDAVQFALEHSGPKATPAPIDTNARIMYLDDWAVFGGTISRFVLAAESLGISRRNITYATLSGMPTNVTRHIIGDPCRDPRRASWDEEGGSSTYVGVYYDDDQPTVPIADMNPDARMARSGLSRSIHEYYARFNVVRLLGPLAVSHSLSANT